jgi:hypothetical protein
MHWLLVGILIFVGFTMAPYMLGLGVLLLPGAIGGTIGWFLSMWVCSNCQDSDSILAAIAVCTIGGIVAPYGVWYAVRK